MDSPDPIPQVQLRWHALDGKPYAHVQLHNPGKLNAMSVQMWRELRAVFQDIQARADTRCVIVSGANGHFCAGGDISEYASFRFAEDSLRRFHEDGVWGGLQAMLDCDAPIIARIEGACMGAGVEIASCCDIRVATASAKFGAPIARLGFPMAPREAQLVGRALGDALARRLLLEAAVLDAQELRAAGFLAETVADDTIGSHIEKKLAKLLTLAPQAARLNKQTLRAIAQGRLEQSLQDAYAYAPSAEHREGIAAFVQKRRPDF